MGSIYGKPTYAATPEGFASAQPQGQDEEGGESSSGRRGRRKKGKAVSFAAGTKGGSSNPKANANTGHPAKQPASTTTKAKDQKGGGEVGKYVEIKAIYPYEDGSFSNGAREPDPS